MGDYEKLNVWKKSHALTCDVYRVTATLAARQHWSLADQMRRLRSPSQRTLSKAAAAN
jgi:23S rRNA-intervening sequence protein